MGEIIQFIPKPNPTRRSLEEMAVEVFNYAILGSPPECNHGTSPCEYLAPTDDSA